MDVQATYDEIGAALGVVSDGCKMELMAAVWRLRYDQAQQEIGTLRKSIANYEQIIKESKDGE